MSIVFKRALVGLDGKRGHTLEGQGRRARARAREVAGEVDLAGAPPRRSASAPAGRSSGRAGCLLQAPPQPLSSYRRLLGESSRVTLMPTSAS